jgi:hypothetical protein
VFRQVRSEAVVWIFVATSVVCIVTWALLVDADRVESTSSERGHRLPDSDARRDTGSVGGRVGLLHSAQEVEVWRLRAVKGPYRVAGDVSANSPGDWARIRQNADRFVANPGAARWNGPSQGDL